MDGCSELNTGRNRGRVFPSSAILARLEIRERRAL